MLRPGRKRMSEDKRKKGEGKREHERVLIYDASWITIKRYFTFFQGIRRLAENRPPILLRGDIKTSEEEREIIIESIEASVRGQGREEREGERNREEG